MPSLTGTSETEKELKLPKPRKPRPSRARGLRTNTGCLTCRKRRVKCDEVKPQCTQCTKSRRDCMYASTVIESNSPLSLGTTISADSPQGTLSSYQAQTSTNSSVPSPRISIGDLLNSRIYTEPQELRFDVSPQAVVNSLPSPNSAPLDWYDLLAEDALNNVEKYNLGSLGSGLSRKQSPQADPHIRSLRRERIPASAPEPWQCSSTIRLTADELVLFQYFVDVVGPILDLFDSMSHFTAHVPRLAVRNVGLLRSLLAVAARHKALGKGQCHGDLLSAKPDANCVDIEQGHLDYHLNVATQYYYETLQYLSQNLLYPSYTKSGEIIATALLISAYEMFDSAGSGAHERHLRGIFWIQRSQDNDGETTDGLRRAAWWAWLRQDVWVALRQKRRCLTIWHPKKRLIDLSPEELATRILYIAARCVDFVANEKQHEDTVRVEQGNKLLQALNDWFQALPSCYQPIYTQPRTEQNVFSPIWIHPPMYGSAIQTYHAAKIEVLLNKPCLNDIEIHQRRQREVDQSVDMICGIALMHQENAKPNVSLDFRLLYIAGIYTCDPTRRQAIYHILDRTLDITRFPSKSLLQELVDYWHTGKQGQIPYV